jgi:hypothetical protein
MGNIKKEEMLRVINENIAKFKNKEYTLYFFVLDTKGNPSASLEYIYQAALTLSERGHKVVMLHQESEFVGVEGWLGQRYANLTHMNVETDNVEISPSDFLFIPEIFANVMLQTKKLPCKRVVIVQNYANICEFMPVSQTLDSLGIIDAIVTSKLQEEKLKSYFPNLRTFTVSPSVKNMFRKNDDNPRKMIINVIAKEQSDANRIVKPFYWANSAYRWVTFRDLRGLSKEFTAEALREAAITIWVDDKTDFGTNLIEAVKCGGIVIAKVPNQIQDWMIEDGELTKSILWFNELDEVPKLLPSVVHSWITDSVPEEVYKNQDSITPLFTEEIQTLEIIECYEKNIINKRLKDFEEAKADIENKVENK